MSSRQYIQVQEMALPDPAVYCPANGYQIPVDPNILEPDPTWYPVGNPSTQQIILTCSDNGDCRIAFYVGVESAGNYVVNVYGAGESLINTQTKANNATYSWQFPYGGGYTGVGQTTFKVVITPQTAGKNLLSFKCTTYPVSNPVQNWQILYAKFNTPGLTSLAIAFAGIDVLQGIEFFSTLNYLGSLSQSFYNCISLKSIQFPDMPALTTLSQSFYGCISLTSCKFGTLPLCSSTASCFYGCSTLPSQVYPSDMPELLDFSNTHYQNIKLTSVTLFNTAAKVNSFASAFYSCNSILSITMPSSLPLLSNCMSTFSSCRMLTTINFCTYTPALLICTNMCYADQSLISFTFPTTLNSLTKLDYTFGWCYAIKSINMPTSCPEVNTMYQFAANCYELINITLPSNLSKVTTLYQSFQNCYQLTTISYPANMDAVLTAYACHFYNNKLASITMPTSMNSCTTLGQFCQANAGTSLTSFTFPASMTGLTTMNACLFGQNAITSITLPPSLPSITDVSSMNGSLLLSSLTVCTWPSTMVNAGSFISGRLLASFNQPTLRVSNFSYSGGPLLGNLLTSINIDWVNSTFNFQASPLTINYAQLSSATIDSIFTALPTVTGKTVNVMFCAGSAGCTPSIAQAKGWTVLR